MILCPPNLAGPSGLILPDAQDVLRYGAFARRDEGPAHLYHDRPNAWDFGAPYLSDVTQYASTGPTGETIVKTITFPSGVLKVGSVIKVYWIFSATSNTNVKTIRLRMNSGASVNNLLFSAAMTSLASFAGPQQFWIQSASVWAQGPTSVSDFAVSSGAKTTYTCTIPGVVTIDFTTQTTGAGDTMALETYVVFVENPP